jgi:uncharacterized protein (TIGR02001 family)
MLATNFQKQTCSPKHFGAPSVRKSHHSLSGGAVYWKGGSDMKRLARSFLAVGLLSATPAIAADVMPTKAPPAPPPAPPPLWEHAVGGVLVTDYNFRGISQSDRGPSVGAYFEPRYNVSPNLQLYIGAAGYSVDLVTSPTGEFDLYGGVRPTYGPFAFDFGAMYYYYPKEIPGFDTDFWEFYAKTTYTVNEMVSISAGAYYAPDWLQTGASGTYGVAGLKFTAPSTYLPKDVGFYVSGEYARYWFGTPSVGFFVFDYSYWNAGLGWTYKAFTLDLRYHDTDLSQIECALMAGGLKWCDSAFIAKLAFDTTIK